MSTAAIDYQLPLFTPAVSTLTGTPLRVCYPFNVAVDSDGNLYVADTGNDRIRKITPEGIVSTFAGGKKGFIDGPGTKAQFNHPFGVAVDLSGNVYVADTANRRIRKITPEGIVSTFAGGTRGSDDGIGTEAQFDHPYGVAVDSDGILYVADSLNHRIRKITSEGEVSTFAGSSQGYKDGTGEEAQFFGPTGVAVDSSGDLYVADAGNHRIRKIEYK